MDKKISLILLEDNPSDVDLIKYELRKLQFPYELKISRKRSEYLDLFKDQLPDIVLSDFNLPDTDGEEALKLLREKDLNLPFILVSAQIGEEKAVEMMRKGANDYIMKDKLGKLVPTIERELKSYESIKRAEIEHNEVLLYSELMNNSNDAICILDENGLIITQNKANEIILGYSINELTGKTPEVFMDKDSVSEMLKFLKVTGKYFKEIKARKKDGSIVFMDVSITSVKDSNGKVFYACIKRDITLRIQKEKQIKEMKEFYEGILENITNGVWVTDRNDRVIYVNGEMINIACVSEDKILGRTIQEGLDDECSGEFKKHYNKVRSTLFPSEYEAKEHTFSKKNTIQRGWLIPLIKDNNFDGMICTAEDVTEKVNIQRKLDEQKRQLQTLVSNLPGMAFRCIADDYWTMTYVSEGVKELTGYTSDELVNNAKISFNDIIDPDEAEKDWSSIYQAMDKGEHYEIEYKIITKYGKIKWVMEKAVPVGRDEYGNYITEGLIIDITERKNITFKYENANTIINRSPSVAFRWRNDKNWTVDYVSDNVVDIFGYSSQEFYSGDVLYSQLILEEDIENVRYEVKKYSNEKERNRFTHKYYRIKDKLGTIKWLRDDTYVVRDNKGEILFFDGIISDVTGIVESRMLLEASEHQYKSLAENSLDRIERYDEECRHLYINPASLKITGFKYNEVIGKTHAELGYSQDNVDEWDSFILDVFKSKKPDSKIIEMVKDGNINYFDWRVYPEFDENNIVKSVLSVSRDITEIKNSQEELHILSTAIEQSPSIVALTDISGDLIYINPKFTEVTGYTFDEILKKNTRILKSGELQDALYEELWNTISSGNIWYGEFQNRRKDGTLYWEKAVISPVKDRYGMTKNYLKISEDITKIKEAELKLLETSSKLRRGEQIAKFGYWEMDLNNSTIELSEGARAIFELEGVFVDIPLMRKIPLEEYRIPNTIAFDSLVRNGTPYDVEYQIQCIKSGNYKYIRSIAEYDKEKNCIFGVANDITERKLLEIDILESQQKFYILYNNAPEMYASVAKDTGQIIECNDTMLRHTGYSRNEIIGMNIFDIYHIDSVEEAKRVHDELLSSGRIQNKRFILKKKNGDKIFVNLNIETAKNEKGEITHSICSWSDISDLIAYDEALKNRTEQLLKQKNELERSNQELEQFAYIASHDLQEPLRTIASFSQLLDTKYSYNLNEEAKNYLDFAVEGAKRMQDLIKGLLEYSRVTTKGNEFKKVKLSDPLEITLSNIKKMIAESGAEIVVHDLPEVNIDPQQISIVFQNLIQNAIKFRSQKDKIKIYIRSEFNKNTNEWEITVEDNGIGISSRYTDRIFTIFHRLHTSKKYPGTGIGLAICKRIIDRHKGTIRAESGGKDKGSRFIFTLPEKINTGV